MTIYAVVGDTGDGEDYSKWTVCAYTTRKAAQKRADLCLKESQRRWKAFKANDDYDLKKCPPARYDGVCDTYPAADFRYRVEAVELIKVRTITKA